jgi:hypothetical protein
VNWVCAPTEIQSHDQNFILPARGRIRIAQPQKYGRMTKPYCSE